MSRREWNKGEPPERWWLNQYHCDDCDETWSDEWECCCDDECPKCGKDYSPEESTELDPETGEPLPVDPDERQEDLT